MAPQEKVVNEWIDANYPDLIISPSVHVTEHHITLHRYIQLWPVNQKNLTNNLRKSKKGEQIPTCYKSLSKCGFLPAETCQWSVSSEFKALLPGVCRSSLAEVGKIKERYLCLESTRRLERKPGDEDVLPDNCTLPLIQWGTLLVH